MEIMTAFCWLKLAMTRGGGKLRINKEYLHSSKDSQPVTLGPLDQEFTTWITLDWMTRPGVRTYSQETQHMEKRF